MGYERRVDLDQQRGTPCCVAKDYVLRYLPGHGIEVGDDDDERFLRVNLVNIVR